MPDHGFHRSQGAGRRLPPARAHQSHQRLDLRRVAQGRGGAMGLDQPDCARVHPRILIGTLQRQCFSLDPGRENAEPLAIAGHADPTHQRIDPVARGLRIRKPLDAEQPDALAQQRAIGIGGEGFDGSLTGQRLQLAEYLVDRRWGGGMHAAHHSHIAPPGPQVRHPAIKRDQRRRTGRIDNVIRALEIEPVGDSPRDQIGYQGRSHLRIEGRQGGLELGFDIRQLRLLRLRVQLLQDRQKPVHHDPVLHHTGEAAIDIGAAPQDHRDPVARHRARVKPRIRDRIRRHLQREELVRLAPVDRGRHHPMAQGIEHGQIPQEPAALGVDPVIVRAVGVEEQIPAPIRRCIRNRIHLVGDITPERRCVGRLGVNRGDPYNGNGFGVRLAHGGTI